MAVKALCPDCDKQEGIVPCLGCKKVFCVKHFQVHRQNLSVELENVVTRRNTLQEDYYNTVAATFDSTKLDAWNTINQLEEKINVQVTEMFDNARKQLDSFSKQSRTQLENRLHKVTEAIQQKMERENFVEEDIETLTQEIEQIEEGIQNKKFHPKIEVISQPIDWKSSVQVKLVEENKPKEEQIKPSVSLPLQTSKVAPSISSKQNYPPSIERKCFECGTDTWQKACKCCNETYCGWHLKRHLNESKKR